MRTRGNDAGELKYFDPDTIRLFTSGWHIKGLKDYPFKGKGQAHRRMDELVADRMRMYEHMEELAKSSSHVLGRFQIYLDVVKTEGLPNRLRWRSPKTEGGRQNWNVITNNPWVLNRPTEVVELVGDIHKRVAELNAVTRMITAEIGLIRHYLGMLEDVAVMRTRAGLTVDNIAAL